MYPNTQFNDTAIGKHLEYIKKHEPQVHAFVEGTFSEELVLNAYTSAVVNEHLPLAGKLLGVKDIINVDGYSTRCGSALPHTLFSGAEASCISKLREAGAIVAGKTVTTEFAISNPGSTRNPRNLAYTPGGSSSGSAAAVAAGFCDIAVGTQTTGSTIRPAGYCGVIGYKPSFGRIARDGVVLFSKSMDHVGLLASNMEVLEKTAAILVDGWNIQNLGNTAEVNIGLPQGSYMDLACARVAEQFSKTCAALEPAFKSLNSLILVDDIAAHNKAIDRLTYGELYRVHAEWFDMYRDLYSPSSSESLELGKTISDQELQQLLAQAGEMQHWMQTFMIRNGVDVWVTPVAPDVAPKGLASTGDYRMNAIWSYTGLPIVTIPTGVTNENLPYAMQIVGRYGQDEHLLQIAKNMQDVIGINSMKNEWDLPNF